jgi:hypothetical protein
MHTGLQNKDKDWKEDPATFYELQFRGRQVRKSLKAEEGAVLQQKQE